MNQNYPNHNLNQINNPKCNPQIHKPDDKAIDSRKGRLLAALALGLVILDAALHLNKLNSDPGEVA